MFKTSGRKLLTVTLLALIGWLAGAGAYHVARTDERGHVRERFQRQLRRKTALVGSEILKAAETLHYLAAFYAASEHVTRDEFARYTQKALGRYPGIQAVEWAPRVTEGERDAHVARMRAEGLATYDIRHRLPDQRLVRAPPRAEHFPVAYVEPLDSNEASLGFDLASETSRRTALERAVQTNSLALSDPIRLVQARGRSTAVLLFLPVFEPGPAIGGEAVDHLRGVVLLVWRPDDLVAHVLDGEDGAVPEDVWIDLQDIDDSGRWLPLLPGTTQRRADRANDGREAATLHVAGRRLRLTAPMGAALEAVERADRPLLVGLLASLLTVLVMLLVGLWAAGLRRAEERKNLRLTRSLLRTLDQGVLVADVDGDIQLINEAARRMLGDLGDTTVRGGRAPRGTACLASDPSDPAAPGDLPLDRALRGERFNDEELLVPGAQSANGLWLQVTGAPLRSAKGEPLGAVVVFRDITATKAYEDSIRQLTTAVDQAADTIFITDREGRILYVNRAFETMTGYTREEALGETPRILKSGTHDGQHYRKFWDAILEGKVWRGTSVNRKKDGTILYGEQSVTPMKDAKGQVTHFVSVTKDMTERRKLLDQEAEMRLAGVIQQRLYPQSPPQVQGLDVAGAVYPMGEACGDYFDFIDLGDGSLAFAIGDVSGHGLGPALIMAQVRAQLRSLLRTKMPIEEAFALLNNDLSDDIPDDCFVSLLGARIDPKTQQLAYINAGHPAAVVVGGDGAVRTELACTGPALGVIPGAAYGCVRGVQLEEGDVVALVTDGITEVHAPDGAIYEAERVVRVVQAHHHRSAGNILEALHASAMEFADGRAMDDDLTLLICKVKAPIEAKTDPTKPPGALSEVS